MSEDLKLISVSSECVSGDRLGVEPIILLSNSVEFLYVDNAIFFVSQNDKEILTYEKAAQEKTLTSFVSKEVLSYEKLGEENVLLSDSHVEYIYRANPISVISNSVEFLYEYQDAPTIKGQVPQFISNAILAMPVPPVLGVQSYTKVNQAWAYQIESHDNNELPWSYTRLGQELISVVQMSPIITISFSFIGSLCSIAVSEAELGQYGILDEYHSNAMVGKQVVIVVQSMDIPFVPVSGEFIKQLMTMTISSLPLPIWGSPANVGGIVSKVVQRKPTPTLPRSTTTVKQSVKLAVSKRSDAGLPISRTDVFQVFNTSVLLAEFAPQVGMIIDSQVVSTAVIAATMPGPHGPDHVSQLLTNCIIGSEYPPLGEVGGKTTVPQLSSNAVTQCVYNINLISIEKVNQVRVAFISGADINWYPSPESILNKSRVARVNQFVELVSQEKIEMMPISYSKIAHVAEMAIQSFPLPLPMDIASSGVFAQQAMSQVAQAAIYSGAYDPVSFLTTEQINFLVLEVAEYPNAHLPTSYLDALSVIETVSSVAEYEEWGLIHRPILINQALQQVSSYSIYPDAGSLNAPIVSFAVTQQVAAGSIYPDKDAPQSTVIVRQLNEQVTFKTIYPDKNLPQSKVHTLSVVEQILTRDLKMYELPKPLRRHRVRVVCRLVY